MERETFAVMRKVQREEKEKTKGRKKERERKVRRKDITHGIRLASRVHEANARGDTKDGTERHKTHLDGEEENSKVTRFAVNCVEL